MSRTRRRHSGTPDELCRTNVNLTVSQLNYLKAAAALRMDGAVSVSGYLRVLVSADMKKTAR